MSIMLVLLLEDRSFLWFYRAAGQSRQLAAHFQ